MWNDMPNRKYFSGSRFVSLCLVVVIASFASACKKKEAAYARLYLPLKEKPEEKSKTISSFIKGEKLYIVQKANSKNFPSDWVKVETIDIDKKIGYVRKKLLAKKRIVVTGDNIYLYGRPSLSSRKTSSSSNFSRGSIAFVIKEQETEEGLWFSIKGGNSKFQGDFSGWLNVDENKAKFSEEISIIQDGLDLEFAIVDLKRGKNRDDAIKKIRTLISAEFPIGEVASYFLQSEDIPLEEVEIEEEDSPTEEDGEEGEKDGEKEPALEDLLEEQLDDPETEGSVM